jgi:hypothetical protein
MSNIDQAECKERKTQHPLQATATGGELALRQKSLRCVQIKKGDTKYNAIANPLHMEHTTDPQQSRSTDPIAAPCNLILISKSNSARERRPIVRPCLRHCRAATLRMFRQTSSKLWSTWIARWNNSLAEQRICSRQWPKLNRAWFL